MAKTSRNGYKDRQIQPKHSKTPLFFVLGGAFILLVTAFFAFQKPPVPFTPQVTGRPSLKTDKQELDFGDVKLGKTVTASFELQNVGDQPLKFTTEPYIEVVEGCWPPTPAIGAMVLQPGQTTTLSMQFMMHAGMEGQHDFRVYIRNNDPTQADATLEVLSNWVP